jgi:hypothetical protein
MAEYTGAKNAEVEYTAVEYAGAQYMLNTVQYLAVETCRVYSGWEYSS